MFFSPFLLSVPQLFHALAVTLCTLLSLFKPQSSSITCRCKGGEVEWWEALGMCMAIGSTGCRWTFSLSGAHPLRERLPRSRLHPPRADRVLLFTVLNLCLQLCNSAFPSRFGGRFVFINHVYMLLRFCLLD